MFVGAIADNFDERIEQKMFHCEIVGIMQSSCQQRLINRFRHNWFYGRKEVDTMKEQIQLNYNRIKEETKQIVADELKRIKNDPMLVHCYNNRNSFILQYCY